MYGNMVREPRCYQVVGPWVIAIRLIWNGLDDKFQRLIIKDLMSTWSSLVVYPRGLFQALCYFDSYLAMTWMMT